MAIIVGVKFKSGGKLYYFEPNDQPLLEGTAVIVETARGLECGELAMERREIPDEQISHELKKIVREATEADLKRVEDNKAREKTAFDICEQKIAHHKLEMKLVSVEYAFDGSKILFSFTADGRVDFRELVRDLASVFRTRIEMRQIGVRDEAKLLGGLGICGRPFCCASYMGDFAPVSIKMAKEQGLSLNPVKISGTCGRLMCCLKYEQDSYEELLRRTPRVGSVVSTPDGEGVIADVNLLTGMLQVHLNDTPEGSMRPFHKRTVKVLSGRVPEYDPDDEIIPEPVEDEPILIEPVIDEPAQQSAEPAAKKQQGGQTQRRNNNRGGSKKQQKHPGPQGGQQGQKQGGQPQGQKQNSGGKQGGQQNKGKPQQNSQRPPQQGQKQGGQNRSNQNRNRQHNKGGKPQGNKQGGQQNRQNTGKSGE